MDKQLRIFAGMAVTNSNLSREAKLQLLNFIKEASDVQVKALLLDGKIISKPDSQTKEIIEQRFDNNLLEYFPPADIIDIWVNVLGGPTAYTALGLGSLAVATFLTLVSKGAYREAKKIITKAGRTCRMYSGNEHAKCVNKIKKEAYTKQIALLSKAKSKCDKTKDKRECVSGIDKKVSKLKEKIAKIEKVTM